MVNTILNDNSQIPCSVNINLEFKFKFIPQILNFGFEFQFKVIHLTLNNTTYRVS